MNLRIMQKMIVGYVFIIVLPTLVLSLLFYNHLYQSAVEESERSRQQYLEQAQSEVAIDINELESVHSLFQQNTLVIQYLEKTYPSSSEEIYTFTEHVLPLFTYISASQSLIKSVRLYKKEEPMNPIFNMVYSYADLGGSDPRIRELRAGEGLWIHRMEKGVPSFRYYKKIHTRYYLKEAGMIEIVLNEKEFYRQFEAWSGSDAVVTVEIDGRYYRLRGDATLEPTVGKPTSRVQDLIEVLEPSVRVYIDKPLSNGVRIQWRNLFFGAILAYLVILTSLYYSLATSIARRIKSLAKHIRLAKTNRFDRFEAEAYADEIGYLISSYNILIFNIDELVNKVHKAELRQKEAAFIALQSQINPHFIYNTLEGIRMTAELNGDTDAAEMAYTLGLILRYNLSGQANGTLKDELDNVANYLSMYKKRLGSRFRYRLQVEPELERIPCPRFILQPIVENCIVHGFKDKLGDTAITIRIEGEAELVLVTVEDNGTGIAPARLSTMQRYFHGELERMEIEASGLGIGMQNIYERLKAFYGPASTIRMENGPSGGTICTLVLAAKGDGKGEAE
ncbi:sensor histidine kinase [Paenibacillus koleovorans]|uniref:sensor histidine kinase n=1 Tax=Paenibacillus koleovorans TaxID=121608 RepID=UPI0013E3C704|nr:histidine kinase [Paenibacillus koleovorans]